MCKLKVAEVRINSKLGIIQIKTNRGPNHILKGEETKKFESRRNEYYLKIVSEISVADNMAATDYIMGKL